MNPNAGNDAAPAVAGFMPSLPTGSAGGVEPKIMTPMTYAHPTGSTSSFYDQFTASQTSLAEPEQETEPSVGAGTDASHVQQQEAYEPAQAAETQSATAAVPPPVATAPVIQPRRRSQPSPSLQPQRPSPTTSMGRLPGASPKAPYASQPSAPFPQASMGVGRPAQAQHGFQPPHGQAQNRSVTPNSRPPLHPSPMGSPAAHMQQPGQPGYYAPHAGQQAGAYGRVSTSATASPRTSSGRRQGAPPADL
ncbi:hypothetical protein BC831DRAFT_315800 [Entophlyctis helioformis]|nr:hypothetical protein BC831DRAFT_315800 [Entophlyctis helioformis]